MESQGENMEAETRLSRWLTKSLLWRLKYISNSNFLIVASIVVGIITAFAAIVLKLGVHYLQYLTGLVAQMQSVKFVYIVLPLCGITITFLIIKYFSKGKLEKGLGSVIYDISWHEGRVK